MQQAALSKHPAKAAPCELTLVLATANLPGIDRQDVRVQASWLLL